MEQRELEEFYYRWHALEAANGVEIVDCDLLGERERYPEPYRDRKAVREALESLRRFAKGDAAVPEFVRKKLDACDYFLRALEGESIEYREYVERTMGIRPEPIPEAALAAQLDRVRGLFAACGYDYDAAGLKASNEAWLYPDSVAIRRRFKEFEDKAIPGLLDWLGLDFAMDYLVDFVERDAYWLNWLGTDEQARIKLQFNMHPRKRAMWQKGVEEVMVMHEIGGHVVQALAWQKRVREGAMPKSYGLTSVFTPEPFSGEGIAQTLYLLYPDTPLSAEGRFLSERSALTQMALSNAHMLQNDGVPDDEVYEYLRAYNPSVEKPALEKTRIENTTHPLFRCYLYVYGISCYHFRRIAASLSPEGKRAFVRDLYANARLPEEILAMERIAAWTTVSESRSGSSSKRTR